MWGTFVGCMTGLLVEITSLSAVSDSIKGYSTSGPFMFTYNGKRVSEIAHETQWKDYD